MLFRTKNNFLVIFDKNGPMELDADEPQKFQGPPDRILGGGGGGGGPVGGKAIFGEEMRHWPLWGRGEYKWVPVDLRARNPTWMFYSVDYNHGEISQRPLLLSHFENMLLSRLNMQASMACP